MFEHELWVTSLFNDHLAGVGNAALSLVGMTAENPDRPWANFVALQIFVFVALAVTFALLRPRLSSDKPRGFQHFFEILYTFLRGESRDIVGEQGPKHLHFFATIFIFIMFANLLGIFPLFESPTMFPPVPLGFALAVFVYYHVVGIRRHGPIGYLGTFCGPIWWLAWLMFPIELISHCGRVLSLTVRLFANIFASENVFLIFVGMAPLAVPAIFLGEHIFKALLQAYIFALLAMVYVQGAVAEEH